jgi:hypothetical protein
MTHRNMKPESPLPATPGVGDPVLRSPISSTVDGATTVALLTQANARAAANDAVAETPDAIRNPLWIIASGMACFFGAAAVVMALG